MSFRWKTVLYFVFFFRFAVLTIGFFFFEHFWFFLRLSFTSRWSLRCILLHYFDKEKRGKFSTIFWVRGHDTLKIEATYSKDKREIIILKYLLWFVCCENSDGALLMMEKAAEMTTSTEKTVSVRLRSYFFPLLPAELGEKRRNDFFRLGALNKKFLIHWVHPILHGTTWWRPGSMNSEILIPNSHRHNKKKHLPRKRHKYSASTATRELSPNGTSASH